MIELIYVLGGGVGVWFYREPVWFIGDRIEIGL